MQFTDTELIIGFFILASAIILWQKKSSVSSDKDSEGRYRDEAVTVELITSIICDEFHVTKSEKLKTGYTEKHIEKQLEQFLQTKIQHVVSQYGLEGLNGQKIDFDIGHGQIGLEIKLANQVFKTSAQNTMVGQVLGYIKSRYSDGNLMLAIFCESEHLQQRAVIKSIRDRLEHMDVKVIFVEI